jgi:hypothetical protein|eukprot:COSAG06_NODE_1093_length_10744_cov_8.419164_2_plen_636_part_00
MRRHHCRICGSLICGACSPHRVVLEGGGAGAGTGAGAGAARAERVCKSCKQREVEHGSFAAAYEAAKSEVGASALLVQSNTPIFAGYLEKKGAAGGTFGRRNWKRRWFVLQRDHRLSYFETTQHSNPLGTLDLTQQTLVVAPNRRGFMLRSATRDFHMRTEVGDSKHTQQWITHLSRAVAVAKGEELPATVADDSDSDEEPDSEGGTAAAAAAAAKHRVHRRVFQDDAPIGIVLVELQEEGGKILVAVESILEGGQAERQEQERDQQQQQQSGKGPDFSSHYSIRPGLVLVEVNAQSVLGWPYTDVVPLLAARPLALGFCEDVTCERLLMMLPPLINVAPVTAATTSGAASAVVTYTGDGDGAGASADGELLGAATTATTATAAAVTPGLTAAAAAAAAAAATSLWESSLNGEALGTAASGDDAPLVLVLLADMLREEGADHYQAIEIFAREPNPTLFSELRHCLCTVTTEHELRNAVESGENETVAAAAADPYVLSALFLAFLREWPGGVLRDIDIDGLMACGGEDDALELLGGLAEAEQDALNAAVALVVEASEEEAVNRMGHAELAVELAAALTSCASTPPIASAANAESGEQGEPGRVSSSARLDLRIELDPDSVQVFVYVLIDFWAEHIH